MAIPPWHVFCIDWGMEADCMNRNKYGMAWHTIKYFQGQGHLLRQLRGHIPMNAMGNGYIVRYADMSARDLAHMVISLAAVCTPAELVYYLRGSGR